MKRKLIISVMSLLCMLLFAACSGKKKDVVANEQDVALTQSANNEYLKVLPANAMAIVKVDLGNLLNKSEILDNVFVKAGIEQVSMELPADKKTLLRSICNAPGNSGINVDAPVYVAVVDVEPAKVVFAIAMSDVKVFEEALSTISDGELETSVNNGMKHVYTGENDLVVAYDSEKVVFVYDDRRACVAEYIGLAEDEMALNNEIYKPVFEGDDDFMSAFDIERYGCEMVECGLVEPEFEPFFAMLQGCALYWSNNFEDGYMVSKGNLSLPVELREMIDQLIKKSTQRHYDYIPANSFAVMSYNFDMTHLYPILQNTGALAELNANGLSNALVKDLLKAISGDYTIACWANGSDVEDLQLMAAVDCSDRSIFDLLAAYIAYEYGARRIDTDVYTLNLAGEFEGFTSDYCIMYKDSALMFMPKNHYDKLNDGGELRPLRNSIKDNKHFASAANDFVIDVKPIRDILALEVDYASEDDKAALYILDMIKSIAVNFNIYNLDAKWNFNESDVNSLKYLADKIISLAVRNNMF